MASLNNCTVSSNSATYYDGGSSGGTLNNCIVYFNNAPSGANFGSTPTFNYCCTTPQPANGTGNFTSAPAFVNPAVGNFHLQFNSPCINSGVNTFAPGTVDFDGNPRIRGGTVDIGAYEFQSPTSTISYAWLQNYGLPADGSADFADADLDGMNNWQEWRAGTNPYDAASLLKLSTPSRSAGQVTLTWTSVANRSYFVQRATDLNTPTSFSVIQANIPGLPGTTSYTDATAPASGPVYYRVGVQ
ncbi:hypothetical protein Cflav_PD5350 [Pedosphaera parvula Ellin514]|uniref:Uncharacterized protein n=1 Tax=Pedosphaera parvula (strain Ellin514) TaxID=320771 RepID=B9XB30_PEDPL|nr:hypothetical protein Cflav_PD5350 [Pedosphaera parvula Ellin514]